MIVIRENRPSFKPPNKLLRHFQQPAMKDREPRFAGEEMFMTISACRHKIRPTIRKTMLGRVRPRKLLRDHREQLRIAIGWRQEERARMFAASYCLRKRRRRFALPAHSK